VINLPDGWARCERCAVACQTSELDPDGVCWRCQSDPAVSTCARCGAGMEYVTAPAGPYWRHLRPPAIPHSPTAGQVAS
jgi:hypothetical protein